MAPMNFEQLSELLNTHFTNSPPIDPPQQIVAGEISVFGSPISLGDGRTNVNIHGLENIQVFARNAKNEIRPTSLQAWMNAAIAAQTAPQKIATDLTKLLDNGQISYYEQGRTFATQLRLDPETKKLTTDTLKTAPPKKPSRTFGQWVKNLFGQFKGPEREAFDQRVMEYEIHRHSATLATVREHQDSAFNRYPGPDNNGQILAKDHDTYKQLEKNVEFHHQWQASPELKQGKYAEELRAREEQLAQENKPVDYSHMSTDQIKAELAKVRAGIEKASEIGFDGPNADRELAAFNVLKAALQNGMEEAMKAKPQGMEKPANSIKEPENAKQQEAKVEVIERDPAKLAQERESALARQNELGEYQTMKAFLPLIAENKQLAIDPASRVLMQAMGASWDDHGYEENRKALTSSDAFKQLVETNDMSKLVKEDRLFDRFLEHIAQSKNPNELNWMGEKGFNGLKDHCLNPNAAMKAKPQGMEKPANSVKAPENAKPQEAKPQPKPMGK